MQSPQNQPVSGGCPGRPQSRFLAVGVPKPRLAPQVAALGAFWAPVAILGADLHSTFTRSNRTS